MKRISLTTIGVVSLWSCLGCVSEPELVDWGRVDVDELERRLDRPTCILNDTVVDDMGQDVLADQIPLLITLNLLESGLAEAERQLEIDPNDGQRTVGEVLEEVPDLGDAQLYVRVACPGDGYGISDNFDHGSILFESPAIENPDLSEVRDEGDALAQFEECQMGDTVLRGEAPIYYVRDGVRTTAVAPDIEVENEWFGMYHFDRAYLANEDAVRSLYELEDGTHMTVEIERYGVRLSLQGVNGSFSCLPTSLGTLFCAER